MAPQMGTRLIRRWVRVVVAIVVLVSIACTAGLHFPADAPPAKDSDDGDDIVLDPLGANAACYICHIPFVREELAKVHLKAKVTCIKCHGVSAAHANDEDIGATKPDHPYRRDQVDRMCAKCHPKHDVPARQVIARFQQRDLPPKKAAVCTDCHGRHHIERAAELPPNGFHP